MSQYNIIDLFAGVGGLSYGFSKIPEFNIVAAIEIEPDISTAYTLNHPGVRMLNCDIADLTEELLFEATGNNKIDLIVGGPPCQSYSTLGKRRMDDRANLFMQYKRILSMVKPKAFVFENVVGILSMDKGKLFGNIQAQFAELGYDLKYKVLDAVDYGVPQHRERVILVGFLGKNPFVYPQPTHGEGLLPYVTLKDAIGDLPVLRSGETKREYAGGVSNDFLKFVRGNSTVPTEHTAPKNGDHLIRIIVTIRAVALFALGNDVAGFEWLVGVPMTLLQNCCCIAPVTMGSAL